MNKRFLAMVLTVLMILGMFPVGVMAEETVTYQLLAETDDYAVYTKSDYPWTESNGTYTSGNKGVASTWSNLKIVFKKDGVVSFDWSVSYTSTGSRFAYGVRTDEFTSTADFSGANYFSGDQQGRESQLEVTADETMYATYYKRTNDSAASSNLTDTATISNIKLSPKVEGGESTVEELILVDDAMGTVTVDWMEKKFNDNGTYYFQLATVDADAVQVGQTYRLKAAAKSGYQFYGWVKEYTFNGVAYKEFLPMQYYTLGTGTADNGATVNTQVRTKAPELEVTFDGSSAYRAVFAETGSYALRINDEFFGSDVNLAEKINNASANDVIEILQGGLTLTESATLAKGALLYVPFRSGWSEDDAAGKYRAGGYKDYNATTAINTSDHYATLTVNEGVTLTVNGKLAVGSVVGYNSQRFQGHISGSHGRINNNGTILVGSGGTMTCYGLVDGGGTMHIDDDAILKENFIIGDFAGGNNSAQLFFTSQMPFKRFSVQNVQCTLQMEAKAQLIAMAHVWASSMYNEAEVVLFANHDKAAFRPNGGLTDTVVLTRTYDGSKALTDVVEVASPIKGLLDVTGIGRTEWIFSDGLTFQPLVVGLGPIELDTSRSDFTIPYNFKIRLVNGTYNLNVGMRIMPGAEVIVESGASVNIMGRLMIMDGLIQTDMSSDRYPKRAELTAKGFSGSGELILNGTLTMENGAALGGVIKTNGTGKLVIRESVYLNNSGDLSKLDPAKELKDQSYDLYTSEGGVYIGDKVHNWVQQDGAKGTYDENTTWFNLPARIYTADGIQQVEAGKTYLATKLDAAQTVSYNVDYLYVADGVYTSSGYTSGSRVMTSATETVSRTMYGVWVDSEASEETVPVAEPTVAGISTATVTYTPEKSGTSTLLKNLQVVDKETTEAKTEKYVFLVKYTTEGDSTGMAVAPVEGVYTIPPEANGVIIEGCLLGDLTEDGIINNRDLIRLRKCLADKSVVTELGLLAADITEDGLWNNKDLIRFRKNYI